MRRRPKCKKTHKRCYPSEEEALSAVESFRLLGFWKGNARAWHCRSCGKWHITHFTTKEVREVYKQRRARKRRRAQ